jgi:hypothetical protein
MGLRKGEREEWRKMKMRYALSVRGLEEYFRAGIKLNAMQEIDVDVAKLSREAREAWLEIFGLGEYEIELRKFAICGGTIYEDGSVSDVAPYVGKTWDWLEQDAVLTQETVEKATLDLARQKRQVEAELQAYLPKWQKALEAYRKRKEEEARKEAEEEAEEEARKERLQNLKWLVEAKKEIDITAKKEKEIQRFLKKFQLQREDIKAVSISDKPYVRLEVQIPLVIEEHKRTLKISNTTYASEEVEATGEAEFSDFANAVAKAVAKQFSDSRVEIVVDGGYVAHLNVVTPPDTIEVASVRVDDDC